MTKDQFKALQKFLNFNGNILRLIVNEISEDKFEIRLIADSNVNAMQSEYFLISDSYTSEEGIITKKPKSITKKNKVIAKKKK